MWPDAKMFWPRYNGEHGIIPFFEKLFEPRDFVVRTIGPTLDHSINSWKITSSKLTDPQEITFQYNNLPPDLKEEIIEIIKLFQPADHLKPQIKVGYRLGIHIRTWYDTINAIKPDRIITQLKQINLNNAYVACDNIKVQEWFYKEGIQNLEPSRSSQRSIIDLYNLSNCSRLILSKRSSFSELSWFIGGGKAEYSWFGY